MAAWGLGGQLRPLRRGPALLMDSLYIAAIAVVLYSTAHFGTPWRQLLLGWTAAEALFMMYGKWRLHVLGRRCTEPPKTDNFERVWERFMELQAVFGIEPFLSGWFLGADYSLIRRGNLEDFVSYAFFNQEVEQLSPRDRRRVESFLSGVEQAWGVAFPPGRTPGLTYMSWLWEPLRVYPKPLAVYAATEAAGRLAQGLLWAMGFMAASEPAGGKFNYWVRVPPPPRPQQPASLMGAFAAAAEEVEELRGLRGLTDLSRRGRGRGAAPAGPQTAAPASRTTPQGLWQRSVAAAAEELWGLRDEVHHLREHAVDAAITMAGTAAAAIAAQHPHGVHTQPWSPPTARRAPSTPLPAAAAVSIDAAAGELAAAAKSPMQRANSAPAAAPPPPEAAAAVSPSPLEGRRITRAAAAAAAAAGSPLPPLPPATEPRRRVRRQPNWQGDSATSISPDCAVRAPPEAAQPATGAAASSAGDVAVAAAAADGEGMPIVFLHGVGFGMLPYLHFVRDLGKACPSSPIVMVEMRHVALRLCWEATSVDDVAHAVAALLRQHGYTRACMAGHSYGTFVISRICQLYPQMVHSVAIMDPVCMLTCYPQLLYNFIYKAPSLATLKNPKAIIDLARYLCSRDLTIAQAFCRKFQWHELMLWPQDLPARSVVVLSGGDDLVPAELVMAQLKLSRHPARVMYHPDLGHGGVLISPKWQADVVAAIQQLVTAA